MIAPFLDIDRDERPEKNLSVRKIGPVGSTCCSYALIASHAQRCRVLRRLQRETKISQPLRLRAYLADQPRLLADQIPHFCDANHIPRLKQRL
jgi:hypothetical protein